MAWKPQPFALHCNECRWSKRYAPRSDLIWEGMIPEKCPRCGSAHLERKELSPAEGRLVDMWERFKEQW